MTNFHPYPATLISYDTRLIMVVNVRPQRQTRNRDGCAIAVATADAAMMMFDGLRYL